MPGALAAVTLEVLVTGIRAASAICSLVLKASLLAVHSPWTTKSASRRYAEARLPGRAPHTTGGGVCVSAAAGGGPASSLLSLGLG